MQYISVMMAFICLSSASLAEGLAWGDFRERVHEAFGNGDSEALISLAQEREEKPLEPAEWNAYWRTYLNYRAAYLAGEREADKEKLEACAETGKLAIERGENSGESHALLGLCFGQLAGTDMTAGMRHGSKAQSMLDEALMIAPENPRVLLAAGINDLYTPAQYGGDIDRAARRLEESRQAFSQRGTSDQAAWAPAWGMMDVHAHLAIALALLDRPMDAREVLRDAEEAGVASPWLDSIRKRLEDAGLG